MRTYRGVTRAQASEGGWSLDEGKAAPGRRPR